MNEERQVTENQGNNGVGSCFNWKIIVLFGVAAVLIFVIVNNVVLARSPGSAGFLADRSCCAPAAGTNTAEQIKQAGLEFYRASYGAEADEAAIEDFGCHQEILIYREGELLHRLAYSSGKFYDLGPADGLPGR
ncbi:MAG: hypothetical protein AB1767_05970 [Bacillota bacterium]